MKRLFRLLPVFIFVLLLMFSDLPAQGQRIEAGYTIRLINPGRMIFEIEARFEFPSKFESIAFRMEDSDNHYSEGYAQFVKQINLYDSDSNDIALEKQVPNKWLAKNIKGKYLLRYVIPIQHLNSISQFGVDETPFYVEPAGILIGTGMIIFPELPTQQSPENFELKFELGNDWLAVLPQKDLGNNRFIMPSLEYVMNSFWAVGAYDTLTIGSAEFPLRIALQRNFLPELNDQLLGNLRKLWDQITRLFRARSEFQPVLYVSRFPYTDRKEAVYNGGAGSPGSISILLDAKLTPELLDDNYGLFAYNLFTQWIPITFFPANRIDNSWLIRGVANYYQLVLLRRIGVMDDQQFLDRLLLMYEQYSREYNRRGISVRAARELATADAYVMSAEMLTALAFDLRLRSQGGSAGSLDKVLAAMAQRFHGSSNVFSNAQFFEMVDTLSGQYLMPFVDSCLNLSHKIELPELLAKFGVRLEVISGGKPDLGATFNSYTDLTIRNIGRGGPASQAGLMAGDRLTGIDGHQFGSVNHLADYINKKKAGDKIKIEYLRGSQSATTHLTLKGDDLYRIGREARPTVQQEALWRELVAPLGE